MGAISVIITIAILTFGTAAWLYKKGKPKKIGYTARVWKKVGSGDKTDLQLYAKDFLVRLQPAIGITKWKLEKTGLFLPKEPSAESINIEGTEKVIDLILDHSKIALAKRSYDASSDTMKFESYDFDKHAFCEIKRAYDIKRLQTNKNPLEYITKWIVVALTMFGLIGISYIQADGWVSSSENMLKASENNIVAADIQANATLQLQKVLNVYNRVDERHVNQNIVNTNTEIPTFG